MTEDAGVYVGPDRRQRLPRAVHRPNHRLLITMALAVLVYGLAVPTAVAEVLGANRSVPAANIATIVCAVLFAQSGLLLLLRWRLTGDGRCVRLGVAALVYGFFIAPLTEGFALLGVDVVHRAAGQSLAQSCVGMVAAVFAVRAVRSPEVDSRLRPAPAVGIGAGALAVVCSTAAIVDRLLQTGAHHLFVGAMAGAAAAVWLAAGAAVLWGGRGGKMALSTLLAGPLLVMGMGSLSWLVSVFRQVPFSLDASALTMTAGVLLAGGAAYALLSTLSNQGASAFRLRELLRNLEQYRAFEEERVHDARSALLAVQAAVTALTRYRERLDEQSRTKLEVAVDSELERLVGLMASPTAAVRSVECRPFDVTEPVVAVTAAAKTFGLTVVLDVPEDGCRAVGNRDDTARVLETLLDNARRYAAGSAVTVQVRGDGQRVQIAVSDRGAGIAPDERDMVFTRGGRGRAAAGIAGSGLGLFAARRLMEDQNGALELDCTVRAGATFVVTLPSAPVAQVAAGEGISGTRHTAAGAGRLSSAALAASTAGVRVGRGGDPSAVA